MQLSSEALDEITQQLAQEHIDRGDHRRGSRVGLMASVSIKPKKAGGQAFPAMLHDISAGGISFVDMELMQIGEELTLILPMADGKTMQLSCVVRHCEAAAEEMYIIGAEFTACEKAATKAA